MCVPEAVAFNTGALDLLTRLGVLRDLIVIRRVHPVCLVTLALLTPRRIGTVEPYLGYSRSWPPFARHARRRR